MWKIAIVFLLVAVNFGYWYWTTTPFYSILEIKESIVHHDLKTFEQYVDVERVSSHMIDGFLTPQVRSRLSKGVLGEMLGSSLIGLVKPTLMDIIKNEVSHFVESNQLAINQAARRVTRPRRRSENATAPAIGRVLKVTKTKEGKLEFSELPAGAQAAAAQKETLPPPELSEDDHEKQAKPGLETANSIDAEDTADTTQKDEPEKNGSRIGGFGLGDLSMKNVTGKLGFGKHAFKKIAFIRVRKNDCTIGVTLFNKRYDTNMLLELRMERQDEHWKLVEVSNFPSFVYLIIAYEQARKDKMG
ncbi:MAG: DUF2939 domain-containing protein [Candidatus Obscuribacterales bacterium]|nr:DUF2939 domain-containing protein [Candidatus Obscuribacterales bacterium]